MGRDNAEEVGFKARDDVGPGLGFNHRTGGGVESSSQRVPLRMTHGHLMPAAPKFAGHVAEGHGRAVDFGRKGFGDDGEIHLEDRGIIGRG